MDILILIGATWRISSLLVNPEEHGPYDVFTRLRYWVGVRFDQNSQPYGSNEVAKLFTCVWCMSVWIGILVAISYAIAPFYTYWFCLPFALSAGAVGLNKYYS